MGWRCTNCLHVLNPLSGINHPTTKTTTSTTAATVGSNDAIADNTQKCTSKCALPQYKFYCQVVGEIDDGSCSAIAVLQAQNALKMLDLNAKELESLRLGCYAAGPQKWQRKEHMKAR